MADIKTTRWAPYEDGGAGALTAAKEACEEELRSNGLDFVGWEKDFDFELQRPTIRAVGRVHRPKLYLAGPMTGIEFFNFLAFDAAAAVLRDRGFEVFSPAEHDRVLLNLPIDYLPVASETEGPWKSWPALSLRNILRDDLVWICDNAEGLALLPGWENSKGVAVELALARALSLPIYSLVDIGHGAYDVAEGLVQ